MKRTALAVGACLGIAACLVGCGRNEKWSEAERQSVAAVAERVAHGVGAAEADSFDQAGGITSAGAYSVISITPAPPSGQSPAPAAAFAQNLTALGFPVSFETECIEPEPGETTCHGAYGDVAFGTGTIMWSASRSTIIQAAGAL